MAKEKGKKKKGGCIKGCLVGIIFVVFCIIMLVLGVILGPVMKAMEFAQFIMSFFEQETDEEKLYDWVLSNGPDIDLSLSQIEGMPYEVSAIRSALECELTYVDDNIYLFDLYDSAGNVSHPQYNLKTLTSNYGVPWQLLLAICTANQFGNIDDFVEGLDNAVTEGYRYKVSEQNIKDVYEVIGTKITYITNYAIYGTDADGNRFNDCPTYEVLSANCITDLSADNTGKFSCVYKETAAGNGIYYPVICLDTVSTWLYNYEFEYELVLDDMGRPIEYKLVNVIKESNVKELISDFETLGIKEDMYDILYMAIDAMPYASSRGISTMLKKELNYYKVNNSESFVSNGSYGEHLAIKQLYGDVFNASVMDSIRFEYLDTRNELRSLYDGVHVSYNRFRTPAANYALKYLYSVYYLPPIKDENKNTVSYLTQWYSTSESFQIRYEEFGKPISGDTELIEKLGKDRYKAGMVYGMTDWDFVCMVLNDAILFNISDDYFSGAASQWLNKDGTPNGPCFNQADLLKPMYDGTWKGSKDYEHTHFTTADAFYDFCVVLYDSVHNKNALSYKILNKTDDDLSSSREGLKVGDLAFRVDGDNASAVGMYVGKINGYDVFIHLGGGSADLGVYQPSVCVSYHEDDGVIHPDGGTVNYNVYVSVKNGSYPTIDDNGNLTGAFIGWRD